MISFYGRLGGGIAADVSPYDLHHQQHVEYSGEVSHFIISLEVILVVFDMASSEGSRRLLSPDRQLT